MPTGRIGVVNKSKKTVIEPKIKVKIYKLLVSADLESNRFLGVLQNILSANNIETNISIIILVNCRLIGTIKNFVHITAVKNDQAALALILLFSVCITLKNNAKRMNVFKYLISK